MSTTYLPDVPLSKIKPHPKNPRLELTDIDDLAADIRAKGVLQPLILAPPVGSSAAYILVAGHRRLAAAKAAGLTTVPATVRDDLDTPAKQLAAILSENTQRTDLTPVEVGDAYAQLVAFPGMTQKKAAEQTGRSQAFVKQRIALAKLPDAARKKMHSGEITIHDAGVIASFVGTPDYKAITAAAGTPNFRFAVQRAKDNAKTRAQIEVLKAHAEAHGWTVPTKRIGVGSSVLQPWNLKGDLQKALDRLPDTEHILIVLGTSWGLYLPFTTTQTTNRGGTPSPEAEAAAEARRQHDEDVQTARRARVDWLADRLKHLVLKPDEQLAVLRELVYNVAVDDGYDSPDRDCRAFVGAPDADDKQALDSWVDGLTVNEAWRALLVLAFDTTACGNDRGGWDHEPSIHLALALGYEASDVELDLITPEVKA